jgi:ABC-type proline/glycine betaine transport system permease subunit
MLLPWRTVAVTLSLLSFYTPVLVGLGTVAGAIIVGLFVFVFALPFTVTVLLEHWYPSPLGVRLIAGARTLAVASVAVALAAFFVGGGGAGWLVMQGISVSDYSQVFEGLSIVVLLALTFDIALGALQVAFAQPPKIYPREVGA